MYDKQTFNKIQLLHIIKSLQSQINKKKKFFFVWTVQMNSKHEQYIWTVNMNSTDEQ